jgi:hypothetical protein
MARGLSRLIAELRAAPSSSEGEEAIARLRVTSDGASTLEIGSSEAIGARTVDELGEREVDVVRLARGVYTSVPTSEARVRLLERARRAARDSVIVHVAVNDEATHVGRAMIDVPRRVLRRAGIEVAEPGDRFGPERYSHCFFDDEALLAEVARAGLAVSERQGFTFVLRPMDAATGGAAENADAFRTELARVVRLVRAVDDRRKTDAPASAVAAMRAIGRNAKLRGPIGRARLRRAIGWVDALLPGGASCYRRILLEIALDAGAARETIIFGLDVGRTGHVAFENREERPFDVSFAIPAP